jgi:hypothetical protein
VRAQVAAAAAALALGLAPAAGAQGLGDPVEEGLREQSCRALAGGTAGAPDQAPAESRGGIPSMWARAPAGLLPNRVVLRTASQTFNRRYEFATRAGTIYVRARHGTGPWRKLPVPLCFAGRVASISLDDDELIALDTARRVYTMDHVLKDASLFNWTARWGTPFWTGPGYSLPADLKAWSWSVVSPLEDRTWTDPAGNRTEIGAGKVSHIWGLRSGGQRLTFWDPWLPLDQSYEMCGPHRGRFRAVNMSASGSFVSVIGRHGDLFTRLYDFDISGHDPVFFRYSYESQRGKGDGAPIQLPAAPWVRQPKVPGTITSAISIHKVGSGAIHRILRVEGERGGHTGYWERDVAAARSAGWTFHSTGQPLTAPRLSNPAADTSGRDLGRSEDNPYRMRKGDTRGELLDYNVYCSPARLRIHEGGRTRRLKLHHVDGLRQQARGRGLDHVPRTQYGMLEEDGRFEPVTVRATNTYVLIEERGWRFRRVKRSGTSRGDCLARRARINRRRIGPLRLGLTRSALRQRLPAPRRSGPRSWRWCVDGGGHVVATFRSGHVTLVGTTASGHRSRRVHPGSRVRALRRTYPRRRRLRRSLVRAGQRLFGLRRGRVRYIAVAKRRLIDRPRSLQRQLRRAGFLRK